MTGVFGDRRVKKASEADPHVSWSRVAAFRTEADSGTAGEASKLVGLESCSGCEVTPVFMRLVEPWQERRCSQSSLRKGVQAVTWHS